MIKYTYKGTEAIFFAKRGGSIKHSNPKEAKFNRVGKLAARWPQIESRLTQLLTAKSSKEAYICLLMAECGIRIGNEDSAEGYVSKVKGHEGEVVQTFGVTTLKKEHVSFTDEAMVLDFVGKKVVEQSITITDPLLVKFGRKFYDESETDSWLNTDAGMVNKFINKKVDSRLVIKDFRTFTANRNAFHIYNNNIKNKPLPLSNGELNREVKEVCEKTSEVLGNTAGICKSAYISHHFINHIIEERSEIINQKKAEREEKKRQREEAWKKMNEERVAQGLPRKNRKRRKKVKRD